MSNNDRNRNPKIYKNEKLSKEIETLKYIKMKSCPKKRDGEHRKLMNPLLRMVFALMIVMMLINCSLMVKI